MSRRRSLRSAGKVALTAAALAATGCGSSFKLPTEQLQNRTAPEDKSYQMIATWTGLTGVTDVLLIPGPQLYLAFKGNPGYVSEYSTTLPNPIGVNRFAGVRNPGGLAANASSVFVLDQGDTGAARGASPDTNNFELDCGLLHGSFRTILDLSKYWYVREYNIKGTLLKSEFTDTTFAWVNGIAADADGRVYVSGVIQHCLIAQFDQRSKTLDSEFRIYRYERGTGDRYVIGGWRRDPGFQIAEGTGVGSTLDPRGMSWSAATGAALFFADLGNNEAQKFDVFGSLANSFKLDICDADTTALVRPTDVAVDDSGNVYVVDAGNRRVLRYDPSGSSCVQRVDIDSHVYGPPLVGPVAAASGDFGGTNFVYVVDADLNQVVVYRKRQ